MQGVWACHPSAPLVRVSRHTPRPSNRTLPHTDNYDNLALLVVICTLSALLPLPLLRMLPDGVDADGPDKGGGGGDEEDARKAH